MSSSDDIARVRAGVFESATEARPEGGTYAPAGEHKHVTVMLLGGYGGIGRPIARLLLEETPVGIVIAGRNLDRAEDVAATLRREFPDRAISALCADASDGESLREAFRGTQLVVVTTTTPSLVRQIGEAALASGCDYLDTMVSDSTVEDLEPLASAVRDQGRVFITQAGFHPGLPAVLARRGAQYFDTYERATIGMAMNARFESPEQGEEIIAMVSDYYAEICEDGSWRKATFRDSITMRIGEPFGTVKLLPIQMVEMKQAQQLLGLSETGVYVSGFNWVADNVAMPFIYVTQKIKKGLAKGLCLRLFAWSVNTFSSPYEGVVMMNEAEGWKGGQKRLVRIAAEHDDAYLFTAIPVVACLRQYLDALLPPGLGTMGNVVDDGVLFRDMERMGVRTRVEFEPAQPDERGTEGVGASSDGERAGRDDGTR